MELFKDKWIHEFKKEHGENCPVCKTKLFFGVKAEWEIAQSNPLGCCPQGVIAYCPKCRNAVVRHLRPEDLGIKGQEWKYEPETIWVEEHE